MAQSTNEKLIGTFLTTHHLSPNTRFHRHRRLHVVLFNASPSPLKCSGGASPSPKPPPSADHHCLHASPRLPFPLRSVGSDAHWLFARLELRQHLVRGRIGLRRAVDPIGGQQRERRRDGFRREAGQGEDLKRLAQRVGLQQSVDKHTREVGSADAAGGEIAGGQDEPAQGVRRGRRGARGKGTERGSDRSLVEYSAGGCRRVSEDGARWGDTQWGHRPTCRQQAVRRSRRTGGRYSRVPLSRAVPARGTGALSDTLAQCRRAKVKPHTRPSRPLGKAALNISPATSRTPPPASCSGASPLTLSPLSLKPSMPPGLRPTMGMPYASAKVSRCSSRHSGRVTAADDSSTNLGVIPGASSASSAVEALKALAARWTPPLSSRPSRASGRGKKRLSASRRREARQGQSRKVEEHAVGGGGSGWGWLGESAGVVGRRERPGSALETAHGEVRMGLDSPQGERLTNTADEAAGKV
eukprot:scaffold3451_cov116-Isochrysis_galbana.AAC.12